MMQDIDDVISHNKESHRFLLKLDRTVTNSKDTISIIVESVQKQRSLHSNKIQTKKRRSLGKLNNASKDESKSYASASSKINISNQSEAHNTTIEIKDDKILEEYTKRIKRELVYIYIYV